MKENAKKRNQQKNSNVMRIYTHNKSSSFLGKTRSGGSQIKKNYSIFSLLTSYY